MAGNLLMGNFSRISFRQASISDWVPATRHTETSGGLDWTGLDWTGLDWTGLTAGDRRPAHTDRQRLSSEQRVTRHTETSGGLDWTGLDWTGLTGGDRRTATVGD